MIKAEGQINLPLYLEEGTEVYCVVTGLGRFGINSSSSNMRGHEGAPSFRADVGFEVLEGELAGMKFNDAIWLGVDGKKPFGASKLQGLMTATKSFVEVNDKDQMVYAWPENEGEFEDLVNNTGVYEVNNWGLRGKVVKVVAGPPYINEKTRDDGTTVTYHNTTVSAFRTPEEDAMKSLEASIVLWREMNPF